MMRDVKAAGGRIAVVAGPVVVHTGGVGVLPGAHSRRATSTCCSPGNALAVHDVEQALFGTSLGVDLDTGKAIEGGHRHHMRAINTICRAGGLKAGGGAGRADLRRDVRVHPPRRRLRAGRAAFETMARCPTRSWTCAWRRIAMRRRWRTSSWCSRCRRCCTASASGNMLPSWVKMVCVDINPAVVTKLADRGSSQTIGIVTDVGLFLHRLAQKLRALARSKGGPEETGASRG